MTAFDMENAGVSLPIMMKISIAAKHSARRFSRGVSVRLRWRKYFRCRVHAGGRLTYEASKMKKADLWLYF